VPKYLLKSKIFSSLNQIVISGDENHLRNEVVSQLAQYKYLTVINIFNPLLNVRHLNPDVIIHFIPKISLKLNNYEYLAVLVPQLQLASTHHSQFILVLNDNSQLARQTLKNILKITQHKDLQVKIVEVDHGVTLKIMAKSIVEIFIHDHRLKNIVSTPGNNISYKIDDSLHTSKSVKTLNILSRLLRNSMALFLGYFLSIVLQISVIGLSINRGFAAFNRYDYSQSSHQMYLASTLSEALISNINIIIPRNNLEFDSKSKLSANINFIKSLSNVTKSLSAINSGFYKLINSPDKKSLKSILSSLNTETVSLEGNIDQLKKDTIILAQSAARYKLLNDTLIKNISTLEVVSPKLKYFISQASRLLGFEKSATYLFLLQDNSRLFPAGGEIDSVVTLTLNEGRASNLQMYKASDLDRLFTGVSVPPPDYERQKGIPSWSFSQNTWNPDFPVTAQVTEKFVSKALGIKSDMVIGLNLLTLRNLISYFENLTFSLNGSNLTRKNYLDKYLELNESNKELSFYGEIFSRVNYQTPVFTSENFGKLLWNIIHQLNTRQIFIQPVGNLLSADSPPDWSGKIFIPQCPNHLPCLQSYLYVADAMMSENTSYFHLTQRNSLDIQISPNTADYHLKTNTTNEAIAKNSEFSVARVYRTVFLPDNIHLLSSKINGQDTVPDDTRSLEGSVVRKLSFTLNIAPQAESTLELRYRQHLPQNSNKFRLQINIPNQPGLINSSLDINIFYPPSWFSTLFQNPQVASPGTLRYNTPISQPTNLDIDYIKR
jgi:hypothetical protein